MFIHCSDRPHAGAELKSRCERARGTTLIELLVVIVIFLIGILAVAQIFPKGFQLLALTRSESVASALARDEVERLKGHPDELAADVVSTHVNSAGNLVIDPNRNPNDLGPQGDSIDSFGILSLAGVVQGDWTRFTGANTFRHVMGEGRQIPAPRMVGTGAGMYGGLILLQFGPIDFNPLSFAVYGNDLTAHVENPSANAFHGDDEYFVEGNPQDNTISLGLPPGPTMLPGNFSNMQSRAYVVAFSAYVQSGTNYIKEDFAGISVTVPNVAASQANGSGSLPLDVIPFQSSNSSLPSVLPSGVTLGSVDLSTLRVRRAFQPTVSLSDSWQNYEPYAYKMLNPALGVLLFSPYAFGQTISGPGGRVALQARIDYDVYDWRILREEFRFPAGETAQHQLAMGSLKVAGIGDFDGRTITGIGTLEGSASSTYKANQDGASDFVLVDMDTGGVFMEKRDTSPSTAGPADTFITVNKGTGLVTVTDLDGDPTNGTQANLLLPDGTLQENVTIDNRAVRALYVARNEFSVQVLKASSQYVQSLSRPGVGQYAIGPNIGGVATRIYFPVCDLGQKVSIGAINYRHQTGDSSPRQLINQDFVISFPAVPDGVGLPCVDVANVDPQAFTLDVTTDAHSFGYAVDNVKGASVTVRVLWNPQFFQLGSNANDPTNMGLVNVWGRGWRKAVNETFLEQGDLIR